MKVVVFVLALVMTLVAGCQGLIVPTGPGTPTAGDRENPTTQTAEPGSSDGELEGKIWILQSINGAATLPDVEVTLGFFAYIHRVLGNSGCNSLGGLYERSGYELDITEIAFTEQLCLDTGIMEQECLLKDTLRGVTTYTIEDDELTLETDAGEKMVFTQR